MNAAGTTTAAAVNGVAPAAGTPPAMVFIDRELLGQLRQAPVDYDDAVFEFVTRDDGRDEVTAARAVTRSARDAVYAIRRLLGTMHDQTKSSRLGWRLAPVQPGGPISARETQILRGLAQGLTYAAMADQLAVSLDTVKTLAYRLYRKLGVDGLGKGTTSAVAVARGYDLGILRPGDSQPAPLHHDGGAR